MTQTEHYQLPQWEAHDPVRREDFNASMERIDAAVAAAQAASGELPYATGSYTGNGTTQTIEVGFRPRFVIVTGQATESTVGATVLLGYIAFSGGTQINKVLSFAESGFSIAYFAQTYPAINTNGRTFSYLAFR